MDVRSEQALSANGKQHNRGQEGAGLACVKLEANPGEEYMFRERALGSGAITEIFENVQNNFKDLTSEQLHDAEFAKRTLPFAGETYMGHLRYSTTGKSGISYVHPFLRRNNWRAKNLALCGNFNMTNVDEIFARITAIGQHPRKYADTYIMLEQVGHRLDREVERVFNLAEAEGLTGMGITNYIEEHIDLANVLRTSSREWDGGYGHLRTGPEAVNLLQYVIRGGYVLLSGIRMKRLLCWLPNVRSFRQLLMSL